MRAVARLYDLTLHAMGAIAAILIAAVALGISLDVIQRNIGWGTFSWMLEASEYAIFVATFLGAPWVLRLGAHVRVDVLVTSLPPRAARVFETLANLVGVATSGVLLYYALRVTGNSIADDARIIKMFIVPEWWVFALVAFAILLIIVEFLRRIVTAWTAPPARGPSAPAH